MKTIVTKNQILAFLILTFAFSWFPWYAGIGPEVMTMGPSLAAFMVVLITNGWQGIKGIVKPFGRWRVNLKWWGLAILGPAVLYSAGIGVHILLAGEAPPFLMIRDELHLIPLYLVLVVLMPWNGPVGEEFGWRGLALPKLQSKFGPFFASLLIGSVWGIWHLPSFLAPQDVVGVLYAEIGLVFILVYTLGTIANSVFMTWIYNKTNASGLVAGIGFHAAINFWAPILLSESSLTAAQEGTLPTITTNLYLIVLAVQVFAAGIVLIATKGKLGYRQENTPAVRG